MQLKAIMAVVLSGASLTLNQASAREHHETTQQACQLISANPPGFHAFPSIPKVIKDKRFKNLHPQFSYIVGEDGRVRNVKINKGTGSPKIDACLVKDIQAWKYKPQPGCVIETSMVITIDVE